MALEQALLHMENTVQQLEGNLKVFSSRLEEQLQRPHWPVRSSMNAEYEEGLRKSIADTSALLAGYKKAVELLRREIC